MWTGPVCARWCSCRGARCGAVTATTQIPGPPRAARPPSRQQLVEKLLRYKPYYGAAGGVTFSGGEPLLQPGFLGECLRLCRQAGIHTCLDTAGVGLGSYDAILRWTDLVLFDVKHETPEATGA